MKINVVKAHGKVLNPVELQKFIDTLPDGDNKLERQDDIMNYPQQKRYFKAIVQPIVLALRDLGYDVDKEVVHRMLAEKFLRDTREIMGEVVFYTRSITSLSKKEMSEYMENCSRWAAMTLGLVI